MITQGKWEVYEITAGKEKSEYNIVCPDKCSTIAKVFPLRDEHEDNARLIAAAPELLAACKDGVKFLDCLLAGNGMSETQLRMLSENRMAFRRILDKAIVKAENQ